MTLTVPVASRSTQAPGRPTRSKTRKRLTASRSALARSGKPGVSFRSPLAFTIPVPTGIESSLMVTSWPASPARRVKSPGRNWPRTTPLPRTSPVMRRSGARPLKVACAHTCPCASGRGTALPSVRSGRKAWASTANLGWHRSSTRPVKSSCASSSESSPRVTSSSRPPGDSAPSTARPASASGAFPVPRSSIPCVVRSWNSASRRRVRQESSSPATSTLRPSGREIWSSALRTSSVSTTSRSRDRKGQGPGSPPPPDRERSRWRRGRTRRTRSSSSRPEMGWMPDTVTSRASALKEGRASEAGPAEMP